MNIFVLDNNPMHAATQHNDKHVVKMILEYAQLLSTAHRILDGREQIEQRVTKSGKTRNVKVWKLPDARDEILYKVTHRNHPCAVWCREDAFNYKWTWELLRVLCDEYYYRYGQHRPNSTDDHMQPITGRYHKVKASGLLNQLSHIPTNLDAHARTPFVQCMPDQYKDADPVQAYRNYYLGEKKDLLKYTSRQQPSWVP